MFEIKVPEFGESIQEVQVAEWFKQPGDYVKRDEEIVELESEKASQALVTDKAGVLKEIKVQSGEFAQVGDILCVIDTSAQPAAAGAASASTTASAGGSTTAVMDAPAGTGEANWIMPCLLYTSPSPRDGLLSRMPSSA